MVIHYRKIDKQLFTQHSKKLIDKNFTDIEPFFVRSSYVFKELINKLYEINICLIFECHSASISLTNHILERLLKISLVYNEIGLGQVSLKDVNSHFKQAHDKFQGEDMSKTINLCCSAGLITKEHKKYLNSEIRDIIRNGFSHSDPNKILKKTIIKFKDESIDSDIKLDPLIQSSLMQELAYKEAFPYFKYVLELMLHIEKALLEKDKILKNNKG